MTGHRKLSARNENGFSLIEVMVSLVVLSMGLLSLTNLQTRSINHSMLAYSETQGALLLQELIEQLRVDKNAAGSGDYNIALRTLSDLTASDGSEPFAVRQRYYWFAKLDQTIPGARASIACNATPLCNVQLEYLSSGELHQQSLAVAL